MRKLTTLSMLLAAFAMTVPTAHAGPGCCSKKKDAKVKSCSQGKAACSAKSACGTNSFPAMLAKVGDKVLDCRTTAGKLAKASGDKIIFLVGDSEFVSEAKAMSVLADASEKFVEQFVTISCVVDGKVILCGDSCADGKKTSAQCAEKAKSCGTRANKQGGDKIAKAKADGKGCCKEGKIAKAKTGGKGCQAASKTRAVKADGKDCCPEGKNVVFRVAGRDFKTRGAAVKAREQVATAVQKIRMSYLIDGEAVQCSSQIDDKAKAAGKVKYCVGESKTGCHLTARVELAKAQFEAAKNACTKLVAQAG